MALVHVNNFSTTLNGPITDSATEIAINSATGLPTLSGSDYYYLTLQLGAVIEIVKVTARSGNTLTTVVRGQQGTSAVAWANLSSISLRATKESFNTKQDLIDDLALTAVTVASDDKVLIQDTSDSDTLKTVTASQFGGSAFGTIVVSGQSDVVADTTADTLTLVAGANITLTTNAGSDSVTITAATTGGSTLADGDYGDVTASSSGTVITIDNDVVTYAKMQNVSATDKVLGRSSSGSGDVEEIACTAAGRALLDDADAAAQRTTLGLGTLATQSGTFSGTSSGTNTGDQLIFNKIVVSGQSDVDADTTSDTLTLVAGTNMTITTSGDSITFASSGGGGSSDSFKTISVSGQSDVVADSATDTLTLVAGSNITITTNATTDEITIAASGGGGGVSDGDKGDITVASSGAAWTIDTPTQIGTLATDDKFLMKDTSASNIMGYATVTDVAALLQDNMMGPTLRVKGSSSSAGGVALREDLDEGTNEVVIRGPQIVASDKVQTLQDVTGTIYVSSGTDIALADGGTGASLSDPNADRILFWDDSGSAVDWLTAGPGLDITTTTLSTTQPVDNLLYNASFRVCQRGTAFTNSTSVLNNNDTYCFDRWNLVSDGNNAIRLDQETSTIPSDGSHALKLQVTTANKKAGICQFLEFKDAATIIGGNVSLSFKARKGGSNATVDILRAAVISWISTADSITSALSSSWQSEGTNPTLATNWTYENTPSNLTLTNSYQTFTIENIAVDTASTKNVGVFIWIDNGDGTVNDIVYITDVKLEKSTKCTAFKPVPIREDIANCCRYYYSTYSMGTALATATGDGAVSMINDATTQSVGAMPFPQRMRVSPTVIVYNSVTGTAGSVRSAGSNFTSSAISIGQHGFAGISSTGLTVGASCNMQYGADAEL